ncbi:MAG: hypothetical protein ABSA84_04555 [Gammaproteobacteria bacterium]|jgi:hypothetical protein
MGFNLIEELEAAINLCNLNIIKIPNEALFLAGRRGPSSKSLKY